MKWQGVAKKNKRYQQNASDFSPSPGFLTEKLPLGLGKPFISSKQQQPKRDHHGFCKRGTCFTGICSSSCQQSQERWKRVAEWPMGWIVFLSPAGHDDLKTPDTDATSFWRQIFAVQSTCRVSRSSCYLLPNQRIFPRRWKTSLFLV